ncbi:MAG: 1-acyl-sn-glycerol-3-phosphate acyltransferase [Myxococcota bacterium]|jgi:1-acyl-sn-glycerol-3-phosphate acyltransferase
MPFPPSIARLAARAIGGGAATERSKRLRYADAGHGYDQFGLHPDFIALGDALASPLYERYFRVKSYGAAHIPASGPAVLAANHSGTLPIDGAMIYTDVLRHTDPPRVPRPVADYFVTSLPVVSTIFARCGVVGGSRGNARALLEAGELLMIFPEGTPGIGKPFSQRYKLQEWRKGHVELAIRHGAPVVPVAVVGAEEQMPQIGRIPIRVGSVPYLPVPAVLFPLPVRYHIHYGQPLSFHQDYSPSDADDPAVVSEAAGRVKAEVQALLERGLELREGVFR